MLMPLKKKKKPLFTSFKYDLAYFLFPVGEEGKRAGEEVSKKILEDSSFFDVREPRAGEKKEQLKSIKLSALSAGIRAEVQKLSIGQVSPLISLPAGHYIFKVLWKAPIITARNQQRKVRLSALLFGDIFKQRLKFWLEERKKRSFIQIFL